LAVLRENILADEKTDPQEEIYRKRHIAAGIPSMYGRYKEKKFDSLGLTFRLESLAEVLLGKMAANINLDYVTRITLKRVSNILDKFVEALHLDGIIVEALVSNLDLLKQALETRGITVDQYLNIFQFTARTVKEIIQTQYIGLHEKNLKALIPQLVQSNRISAFTPPADATPEEVFYQTWEWFIRDYLATRFSIQLLDNFIGKVLAGLAQESQSLDSSTRTILLRYDPDKCFLPFQAKDKKLDTQIDLGNKGYFLKRLHSFGHPMPPGFVITTELFRCRHAILSYRPAKEDFLRRLALEVQRLEKRSDRGFGDSQRPLLLSVRSGSPISMPGMMDTFLNIGVNDQITEKLSQEPRFEWAAWDNYRRFLQCWGMSFGIPRNRFDDLMSEAKKAHSATYKRELRPKQMREVVGAYKELLDRSSVEVPSEPWKQLETAIYRVLDSWDSETAVLYRQAMKIADEWGTAVVVQQMVFGNLDTQSGTGVVFTRNPKKADSAVSLFGDYTICAQGEDVVSGLVATHPISLDQVLSENLKAAQSLEERFPRIYHQLRKIAEDLIHRRGFNHQDIEFTFENKDSSALYILQTRDIVSPEEEELWVFIPSRQLKASQVGSGIGVGGGALCGLAVHRFEEIRLYRQRYPGTPLIMIRPDTVPDDIDMVLQVDGILTARGGSTSHAAITAYRLGKTCVVGCPQLQVNEKRGKSIVGDHTIHSGEWLGLDGRNGFVYVGQHETVLGDVHGHLTHVG
jgi:pyruvate,orthophosphate dikinase